MTPTDEKQTWIDRLAAARNDLLLVLRGLPEAARTRPCRDDGWSPRDIVGHVASWEDRYITLIQQFINGHAEQIEWIRDEAALDAWNAQQYLRKRDWSWDETLRELALLREELLWNLGWATPEQLNQQHATPRGTLSVATLLRGLIEHDQEHMAELSALRRDG